MGNTIPSGISFELSDDERMMIDSVRHYCQTEIGAFVIYAVMVAMLIVRPQGLFGRGTARRG